MAFRARNCKIPRVLSGISTCLVDDGMIAALRRCLSGNPVEKMGDRPGVGGQNLEGYDAKRDSHGSALPPSSTTVYNVKICVL
jgi:hypothetical protein